jgi:hypothetical protein
MEPVRLQVIDRDASPEEVAAIVAAVTSVLHQQRALAAVAAPATPLDAWVQASRLGARRLGLQRGPWRLSGRMGRRSGVCWPTATRRARSTGCGSSTRRR